MSRRGDPFAPIAEAYGDEEDRSNSNHLRSVEEEEEEAFMANTPENEDDAPPEEDDALPAPRGERNEDFRGDEPTGTIKSLAEVDPDAYGIRVQEDNRIGVSIEKYRDLRTMQTAKSLPLTTEVHIASIESYLVYSATKITALKGVLPHFILLLLVTISVLMLRLDGSANDVSRTLTTDFINEESLGDVTMSSQAFEFAEGILSSFFVPTGDTSRHVFESVDQLVGTSSLARKHNDLTFVGLLSFRFLRAELSTSDECGESTSALIPSEEVEASLLTVDDASSTTQENSSYCISGSIDYSATPDPGVLATASYNTSVSAQGNALFEGHHLLGKLRNYGPVTSPSAGFNVVQLDLPVQYNDTAVRDQLKLQFDAASGKDSVTGEYVASGRVAAVVIDGLVFDSQTSGLTHVSFIFEAQRSGTSVRVVTYPFLLLSVDFSSALNAIAFLVDCFLVLYWIYWIYELFFTLKLNYDLHHHVGSLEWFGFWEMFNIVTFLVSTVYFGLKGYFWYEATSLLSSTETSMDGTELFRSLMSFRDFLEWSLGGAAWLVMMIYLRSFFFLRFSFRLSTVSETIGSSRHEMTGVMLIFVMVFVAYGYAGELIFGPLRAEEFGRFTTAINFLLLVLWNGEVNDYVVFEDQDSWSSKFFFSTFFVLSWIILLNVVVGVLALSFASVTETLMMMRRPSWSPVALARDALNVINRFGGGGDGGNGGAGRWSLYIEERRQLHATLIDLQAQGIDNFQSGPEYVTLGYLLKRTKNRFHPDYIRLIFHKATQQIGTDNARLRQLRLAHRAINNGVGISQRLKAQSTLVEDLHRTCCIQKSLEIDTMHKVTATNPEYLAVVGDVSALQYILSSQILQLESASSVLVDIAQELEEAERNSNNATRKEAAKLLSGRLSTADNAFLSVPTQFRRRGSLSPISRGVVEHKIQGEEAVVDTSFLLNMKKLAVQRCQDVDEPNARQHAERYSLLKHQEFLTSLSRRVEIMQGEERGRVIVQLRWDDVKERLQKSGKWTPARSASPSLSSTGGSSNRAYLDSIRNQSSTTTTRGASQSAAAPSALTSSSSKSENSPTPRKENPEPRNVHFENHSGASSDGRKKPPPKKKAENVSPQTDTAPTQPQTGDQEDATPEPVQSPVVPKKPAPKKKSLTNEEHGEASQREETRAVKPKPKPKSSRVEKGQDDSAATHEASNIIEAKNLSDDDDGVPLHATASESFRIRGENEEATETMLRRQQPKLVVRNARSFKELPSSRTPDPPSPNEDDSTPVSNDETQAGSEGNTEAEKKPSQDEKEALSPTPKKAPPKKSSQAVVPEEEVTVSSEPKEDHTATSAEPSPTAQSPRKAPGKRPAPKSKPSRAENQEEPAVPVKSESENVKLRTSEIDDEQPCQAGDKELEPAVVEPRPNSQSTPKASEGGAAVTAEEMDASPRLAENVPDESDSHQVQQQQSHSPSKEGSQSRSESKDDSKAAEGGESRSSTSPSKGPEGSSTPSRNTSFSKAPHSTASPQTKRHKRKAESTSTPPKKPAAKASKDPAKQQEAEKKKKEENEAAEVKRAEEMRALEEEAERAKMLEQEHAEREWRLQLAADAESRLSQYDEQPMRRRLMREEAELWSEVVSAGKSDKEEQEALERARLREEKLEEELQRERREKEIADSRKEAARKEREEEAKRKEEEDLVARRQRQHRELVERRREAERKKEEERVFKEQRAREEAEEKRRAEAAAHQRQENLKTFEIKRQQSLAKIRQETEQKQAQGQHQDASSTRRQQPSPSRNPGAQLQKKQSTLERNSSVIFSPSREIVPITHKLQASSSFTRQESTSPQPARAISPEQPKKPKKVQERSIDEEEEEGAVELLPSTTVTVEELQAMPEEKQEEVIQKEEDRNLMNRALTRNPIRLDSRGQLKLTFGFTDAGFGRKPQAGPQNPLDVLSPVRREGTSPPRSPHSGSSPLGTPRSSRRPPTLRF